MKKWLSILIILPLLVGTLKLIPNRSSSQRTPASYMAKVVGSCVRAVNSFRYQYGFDLGSYNEYLINFEESFDPNQVKFDDTEEYVAWLDYKIGQEELSLGHFLARRDNEGKKNYLKKWLVSRSAPDKVGSFLFRDIFEYFLYKSVTISKHGSQKKIAFRMTYAEKLVEEALRRIDGEPEGKFARFMHSKVAQRLGDIVSAIPIFYGLPPLRFPKFLIGSEEELLKAKNLEEFKEIYKSLSEDDMALLHVKKKYDVVRKYYIFAVAGLYSLYSAIEIYEAELNVDTFKKALEASQEVEDDINHLIEMASPTCKALDSCLEELKSEWENKEGSHYLEAKNLCRDLYHIPEDCL